jgi:hypothetical protein
MSYSIVILTIELETRKRDLDKSFDSFQQGDISFENHECHRRNVEPKIKDLEEKIEMIIYCEKNKMIMS